MIRYLSPVLVIALLGCTTTTVTVRQMTPREQETMLLREVDRSRKRDEASIQRLLARARREGPAFLAKQEEKARDRSISLYRSLVSEYLDTGDDLMAEASFRLAELLFEAERERLTKILDKKGVEGDLVPDFSEAIKAYSAVVMDFPGHPLVEDALYGLAYCYTEQGDPDKAAQGYLRLIKLYPETRYSMEINMRLGEYYFDLGDMGRAQAHYRVVIKKGETEYLDKAYYKLGWSLYNQDRYEEAINSFFQLLDLDNEQTKEAGSLVGESIDIIARSYAESSGTPGLARRLAKRGKDSSSPAILLKLADLFKERSLYPEAVGTYRTFIKNYPEARELPLALSHLGESYHIRGDLLTALELSESYPTYLGPGSPLYKSSSEEEKVTLLSLVLDTLEKSADRRRARAKTGGSSTDMDLALNDMNKYVELAEGDIPCRTRSLLGTIQSELGMYPQTPATFNNLASDAQCQRWAESASLQSIDFQLKIYEEKKLVDLDILAESVNRFVGVSPDNASAPRAILAMGEIFSNTGNYRGAREWFSRLIRLYPSSSESSRARTMMARTFFQENRYRQAAAWFKEAWRKSPGSENGKEARRLHIYSLFKEAEKNSDEGQISRAAERFESLFRSFPDSDVAQVSLYNAGKLYKNMGLEMKATDIFEELAAAYETSSLGNKALQTSILILEALGDPKRAAEDALALAERSSGDERAKALLKSADLFRDAGAGEKAAAARKIFTQSYPDPPERLARQLYLLGEDYRSALKWNLARDSFSKVIRMHRKDPDNKIASEYAARAQLSLGEEVYGRYTRLKLDPPIEASIKRKRDLLKKVIKNFVDAGKYRVSEVATAANYYIGRSLEQFKDDILESAPPAGLTDTEMEEYTQMLQEIAYPFEEKALEAYRVNVIRSQKLKILDEWIERSFARLSQLAPWAYEREERLSYPLTLIPVQPLPIPFPETGGVAAVNDHNPSKSGVMP